MPERPAGGSGHRTPKGMPQMRSDNFTYIDSIPSEKYNCQVAHSHTLISPTPTSFISIAETTWSFHMCIAASYVQTLTNGRLIPTVQLVRGRAGSFTKKKLLEKLFSERAKRNYRNATGPVRISFCELS